MKRNIQQIDDEIEKTLDVATQIKKVEGNPFLFTRIQEQLKQEQQSTQRYMSWQWALAMILVVANIVSVVSYTQNMSTTILMDEYDIVAKGYGIGEEDVDYISLWE